MEDGRPLRWDDRHALGVTGKMEEFTMLNVFKELVINMEGREDQLSQSSYSKFGITPLL